MSTNSLQTISLLDPSSLDFSTQRFSIPHTIILNDTNRQLVTFQDYGNTRAPNIRQFTKNGHDS